MNNFSYESLSQKSKAELLELAMEHNILGYKKLNKTELIEALSSISKGKAEIPKEEKKGLWSKYHNHIYGITSILGLILAVIAFLPKDSLRSSGAEKTELAPKEIRNARIAVFPFENKTNDEELGMVGMMAADWITEGLSNLKELKVVSTENILSNMQFATPNESGGVSSDFQKLTGAEKLIKGNYYKLDGRLIFKTKIIDAQTGAIDLALKDIEGPEDDLSKIIATLSGKIMGYFVTKDYSHLIENPPTYEAFKAYLFALQYFGIDDEKTRAQFDKAIELDSNYFDPYAHRIVVYTNSRDYETADSLLYILEKQFPVRTRLQDAAVAFYRHNIDRDLPKKRDAVQRMFDVDPKFRLMNYLLGNVESNMNRPYAAIAAFEHMDTSAIRKVFTTQSSTWWATVYAYNLNRIKRYDDAIAILDLMPEKLAESSYYMLKAEIDVANNNGQDLDDLIDHMEEQRLPVSYIADVYRAVGSRYALIGEEDKQKEWSRKGIAWLNAQPEGQESNANLFNLAELHFLAQDYAQAISNFKQLYDEGEIGSIFDTGKWHYLSRVGTSYARMGDEENARAIVKELAEVVDPTPSGRYTYGQARIYAQLGDKDKSIELMKQAFDEGFINNSTSYRYGEDVDFVKLQGDAEFENFVLQKP